MPDAFFLCLSVVFFAVCWGLVAVCEQLGAFAQSESQANRSAK